MTVDCSPYAAVMEKHAMLFLTLFSPVIYWIVLFINIEFNLLHFYILKFIFLPLT